MPSPVLSWAVIYYLANNCMKLTPDLPYYIGLRLFTADNSLHVRVLHFFNKYYQ